MPNKLAVITGANAGLGFQIALTLARTGTDIVMACRNPQRADKALQELRAAVPGVQARVLPLDVSEPASLRAFVRAFSDDVGELDLLINNAGVAVIPLQRNSAGHEMQLAINHLGAFTLNGLLLPHFRAGAPGRIVNVGSLAHRMGTLDLEDLNWERTKYDDWKGYSRSKLALLTYTLELDRRLRGAGSKVAALAAHPGFAATEISKNSPTLMPKNPLSKWLHKKAELHLIPTAAQACAPIIHAATAANVSGGDYYGPSGLLEISGKTGKARLNRAARNREDAARLWAASEAMTGVRYLSA